MCTDAYRAALIQHLSARVPPDPAATGSATADDPPAEDAAPVTPELAGRH